MKKEIYLTVLLGCCLTMAKAQTNYLDNYISSSITLTTIGTSANSLNQPKDLDFKPNSNELWVCQYGTSSGGNNVIFYNAGLPGQTSQYRKDTHTSHFMRFPSAMAMGDDGMWACVSEIQSTGGATSTFMGPALWTSDTSVFARVFQNNWVSGLPLGSHYDMLHQSPFAMGIAHDSALAYWVMDGYNGNICKYDFVMGHGPGYDNHSAGKIWRYIDVPVTRVVGVPSHMVLDKSTGWLYFIDGGNKKIKRLNTNTGAVTGNLTVPGTANEPLAGYYKVEGAIVETLDSLSTQPCGIDVYNGRLIVSDNTTGDIYLYDITGAVTILDTIVTGQPDMMGIKVGPDGHIWCVNKTQNKVFRLDAALPLVDAAIVSITSPMVENFQANYYSTTFNVCSGSITPATTISNKGTTTITDMEIHYWLDGGVHTIFNYTGSLATGTSTSVTLPTTTVTNGSHLLTVEIMMVNGMADDVDKNNIMDGSFRAIDPPATIPFSEGFSAVTFPPAGWQYINYNPNNFMKRVTTGGFGINTGGMKMDNYSGAEDITGQNDYLMTPIIDFTSAPANTILTFNVAYAQYNTSSVDELKIMASTDCGTSWSQIYDKLGTAISTAPLTTAAFTPTSAQWRTDTVDLASYVGQAEVILMFTSVSNYGNNLYIDDINIKMSTAGIADIQKPTFNVFPNPTTSIVTIQSNSEFQNAEIRIINALGETEMQRVISNTNNVVLDISSLANGVYFVELKADNNFYTHKIIKQ